MPKEQKKFTFGGCSYVRTLPDQSKLSPQTRVLNIDVTFVEALKFNIAVNECIRKLNSYKKIAKAGKNVTLRLALFLDQKSIAVNEGSLKYKK